MVLSSALFGKENLAASAGRISTEGAQEMQKVIAGLCVDWRCKVSVCRNWGAQRSVVRRRESNESPRVVDQFGCRE